MSLTGNDEEISAQKENDDSDEIQLFHDQENYNQDFSGRPSSSSSIIDVFYDEVESEPEDYLDDYWTPVVIQNSQLPDRIKRRMLKQSHHHQSQISHRSQIRAPGPK